MKLIDCQNKLIKVLKIQISNIMSCYKSIITMSFILLGNISLSQDLKYGPHGFDSLHDLAQSYLNILKENYIEDSVLLMHFVGEEQLVYIIDELSKIDSQARKNKNETLMSVNRNYNEMAKQPLFVTKNIRWLIQQDSVDLKTIRIESVSSEIIHSFNFSSKFIIVKMKLSLLCNERVYELIIENVGRIMNKWYILGANISWNNKYAMYDRLQVEFEKGIVK